MGNQELCLDGCTHFLWASIETETLGRREDFPECWSQWLPCFFLFSVPHRIAAALRWWDVGWEAHHHEKGLGLDLLLFLWHKVPTLMVALPSNEQLLRHLGVLSFQIPIWVFALWNWWKMVSLFIVLAVALSEIWCCLWFGVQVMSFWPLLLKRVQSKRGSQLREGALASRLCQFVFGRWSSERRQIKRLKSQFLASLCHVQLPKLCVAPGGTQEECMFTEFPELLASIYVTESLGNPRTSLCRRGQKKMGSGVWTWRNQQPLSDMVVPVPCGTHIPMIFSS